MEWQAVMGNTGILLRDTRQAAGRPGPLSSRRWSCRTRWATGVPAAQALAVIGDVLLEQGDLPGAYKMYQEASSD
jgi:hypothetical protein